MSNFDRFSITITIFPFSFNGLQRRSVRAKARLQAEVLVFGGPFISGRLSSASIWFNLVQISLRSQLDLQLLKLSRWNAVPRGTLQRSLDRGKSVKASRTPP
jgi:hypothetical protein